MNCGKKIFDEPGRNVYHGQKQAIISLLRRPTRSSLPASSKLTTIGGETMRCILAIILFAGVLACGSCGTSLAPGGGRWDAVTIPAAAPSLVASPVKLMIFGGSDHKTYLGCLNCNKYAIDSILNTFGEYGSQYSSSSIFNRFGDFGSPYSTYSACNSYATDPPVIVDSEGKFYGRLTVNQYNSELGVGNQYQQFLQGLCH